MNSSPSVVEQHVIKKIFNTWYKPLEKMLISDYFTELLAYLDGIYSKQVIYPTQKNVFKAFECDYNSLRIVILGQDPYPNQNATGLAFANPDVYGLKLSPSLKMIKECVENTAYDGLNIDFSPDLLHWKEQGILLLNTALTVKEYSSGSHSELWAPFTRTVIKAINNYKSGIIFMLWGNHAQEYEKYIDSNRHTILKYHHPSFSARNNTEWKCDHFVAANRIIGETDIEKCIEW